MNGLVPFGTIGRPRGLTSVTSSTAVEFVGISHKDAGIIHVAFDDRARKVDCLIGSANRDASVQSVLARRNDDLPRLTTPSRIAGCESTCDQSFLQAIRRTGKLISGGWGAEVVNCKVPGLPSPLHVPPVTLTASGEPVPTR